MRSNGVQSLSLSVAGVGVYAFYPPLCLINALNYAAS